MRGRLGKPVQYAGLVAVGLTADQPAKYLHRVLRGQHADRPAAPRRTAQSPPASHEHDAARRTG
jgi:hypothetical protein